MKRKKIIIFADGPKEDKKVHWGNNSSAPPPTSIFPIDDNRIGVYERDEINPGRERIEYVYRYEGERQEL